MVEMTSKLDSASPQPRAARHVLAVNGVTASVSGS